MNLVRLVRVDRIRWVGGLAQRAQDSLEPAPVPAEDGQGQVLVAAEGVLLAGVEIDQRQVEPRPRSCRPNVT
jgi:hypothetical protein